MKRYDLIVIGAGPAGLSGAIEAAKGGAKVIIFDENSKPGGQLFKQIHKFFGSKEYGARIRGFEIGRKLLNDAREAGVQVCLNATVTGIYSGKEVTVKVEDQVFHYRGDSILVATGACENAVSFPGWTLPGVMGAGAAQTLMNLHGVRPGKRVLIIGSGNVGLVVGYQLLQSGCQVVAVVDVLPRIGGYGVHAAKLSRTGIPFYLSHTIVRAEGKDHVEGAVIGQVDKHFHVIPGTEKYFSVDTICLAVGLSPMSQLLKIAGCQMNKTGLSGETPFYNQERETSVAGIFTAGDVSGIEEASSAMIEGKIAGAAALGYLGYLTPKEKEERLKKYGSSLEELRQGMFSPANRGKKISYTDEGYEISTSLLEKGYIDSSELERYPGVTKKAGVHPVIECCQNIPCNPCQDVCPKGCITIGEKITALPIVAENKECIGCGLCVASCSGQAIFLVNEQAEQGYADVTIPYEFLPLPEEGEEGVALTRKGDILCPTRIVGRKTSKSFDHTALITMRVPAEMAMEARFFKNRKEE